jgi:hypothetical protein
LEERVAGHRAQARPFVLRAEYVEPGHREPGGPDCYVVPQGPFAGQRHQMRPGGRSVTAAGGQQGAGTAHHVASLLAGLPGDLAEKRPDRLGRQFGGVAVVVGGEGDQVAAVGPDGVGRRVGVGQVGEEVVDVPSERVSRQGVPRGPLGRRPGSRSTAASARASLPGARPGSACWSGVEEQIRPIRR